MVLKEEQWQDGKGYSFFCPGCGGYHIYLVGVTGKPSWKWNGSMDKPTFEPSLRITYHDKMCHLYVRNGKIEYCSDATHNLAGKTVDLPDWDKME